MFMFLGIICIIRKVVLPFVRVNCKWKLKYEEIEVRRYGSDVCSILLRKSWAN